MANEALSALNSDILTQIQNLGSQPSQSLLDSLQSTNTELANTQSPYKFKDWASAKGYTYNYDQATNTHTLNNVALPSNIMNTLQGEYGTPTAYDNILGEYAKLLEKQAAQAGTQQAQTTTTDTQASQQSNLETGEYVSPYQSQIQAIIDQLNQFTPYQSPEELEQYIYQLLQSANQPFTYDPSQDQALIAAQKEAGRAIREGAGAKGTLYSSGTISNAAKAKGALTPQYEQKAYSRFADQRNREVQMVSTLMQWDQMQADRHNDQLEIVKTKFDYIMKLESQDFDKFQIMLEQRNFQKEYDLEMQSLQLQRTIQEIEEAYARVDALGYVDNQAATVLGMKVGEKASWVKQLELEHKQELDRIKKEFENEKKLQKEQSKIEKELIQYKNKLEEASKKKLMAEQYKYDKKLAEYQGKLALGGSIASGSGIISMARSLKGIKYVWGGTSTKGFDCSGFTQYVFKQQGVNIPRVSADQAKSGTYVSKSSLKSGDLVFFDTISGNGKNVDHVGIYIGNGKMIHASSSNGKIVEVNMNTSYWNQRYTTARRYTTGGGSSSGGSYSGSGGSGGGSVGKNASSYSTSYIQKALNKLGYKLSVDGSYGAKTTAAVKKFQKKYGLKADGIVGSQTLAALGLAAYNKILM